MGKPLRQQNETNNYFLLQLMAGIGAATLAAAAIAAFFVLKSGATVATAAGLAATNMMFASSLVAATPILPMLVMGGIGFVFLMALLNSCGSSNNNTTVRVVPNRPYGSFWGGPTYDTWCSSPTVHVHDTGNSGPLHHRGGHVEVHNGPIHGNGPTHDHPSSSGNVHNHFPSHGGGARVEVHNTHGHRMM